MWLDQIYQATNPIAFVAGPFTVRWYGIGYLVGFVIAGVLMYRIARRWKLDLTVDDILEVVIGLAFGVIIGARLGYVLFYGAGAYLANPLEIFAVGDGGMSFHGGLIGAVVGGSIAALRLHLSIPTLCDLGVIGACPAIFLVRCANFVNGELWGKPCDLPWAVAFETGGGVYRHPSQLYEAILEGFVMFIVLYAASRRMPPRPQGSFIGKFLTLYGIFRILIEFVRVPDAQLGYLFGPITMGQVLSLPLVLIGVAILVYAYKRKLPQMGHIQGASS